jgi:hypothetical protein
LPDFWADAQASARLEVVAENFLLSSVFHAIFGDFSVFTLSQVSVINHLTFSGMGQDL